MRRIKWLVPVFALGMLMGIAPNAKAQMAEKPWVIEGYGGAFIPLSPSSWTDAVGVSAGIGAAVGYQVAPKIYILVNGAWGLVTGSQINDVQQPDWDVFGYYVSGAYDFTEGKPVSLLGQLGVGANTFKPDIEGASSTTDIAVTGGFKVYYNINPTFGVSLNALLTYAFTEGDATLNLPISAGVFFRL